MEAQKLIGPHTDITVQTKNHELLNETVQQLGTASVVKDSFDGEKCTVRIFGDPGYIKFAIEQQGYGKIVITQKESS